MKTVAPILVLLLLAGCEEEERSYEDRKPCTCEDYPESYVINLSFQDEFLLEPRSFPYEIHFGIDDRHHWDRHPGYRSIPTGIYRTKGISGDQEVFYYSLRIPQRQDNGLIFIEQIDGGEIYVEYKDIEVTLIPVKPLPLDAVSLERIEYAKRWNKYRIEKCPRHKY